MNALRNHLAVFLISHLLAAATAHAQSADVQVARTEPLQPGETVTLSLPSDTVHIWTIEATEAQYYRLAVDHRQEDYILRVIDPSGTELVEGWTSCGERPSCIIPFFAERPGTHRIELRPLPVDFAETAEHYPADVRYSLLLEEIPPEESEANHARLAAAVQWLRTTAMPLSSVTAGGSYGDLLPLKTILEGVRIVGLGEATHGTREFFQVKHRLLEFLVREMGFTLFAMELDQGMAQLIDDYVLHGRGTASQALASQQMWQWDREEVTAMIEWTRDYNRRAPAKRQVRFLGFDLQTHDVAVKSLLEYLGRVAPDRAAEADALLRPLVERPDPERPRLISFWLLEPPARSEIQRDVNALLGLLVLNQSYYVKQTSQQEYDAVLQHTRRLAQFTDVYTRDSYDMTDPESGVALRDRYMAENAMRLLDEAGTGEKMVIWAANEHIRRDAYNMGWHLAERFGATYYAFGLAFNRGGFRVLHMGGGNPMPQADFTLGPALQGAMDWVLPRAGMGDIIVDFRNLPEAGPTAEWFAAPRGLRMIGNSYAPMNPSGYYRLPVVAGRSFDGIVFIEETTPARSTIR